MNLIDTHAHLYWDSYKDDFEEVIKRCKDAGIIAVVNVGVDIEKSKEAIAISSKLASLGIKGYSAIGIHPHEAIKYTSDVSIQKDIRELEQIYQENQSTIVAIGECGLDFYFDPSFAAYSAEVASATKARKASEGKSLTIPRIKILQKKLFQAQIDLAKKLNLPLVVHCRDDRSKDPQNSKCWDTAIDMTKDHFGVYHCYSGLSHTTNYLLSLDFARDKPTNFLVAFAGNLAYPKNEYLREAVKLIPLNRILLETDSPFLAPQSKRGQRNEPSAVLEIAQLIADLKRISFEEVANQTTKNAVSVLSLRL